MSHVIGIDLGTTNSCVAVPDSADIPGKEELLASRRLIPSGGALVVTDRNKRQVTPSAVWADPSGKVEVGARAKQMARRSDLPPPALYFKRLMGTDQTVRAGHQAMTPEEASAHVLSHLKGIAEEVLGEEVNRAVITVPAFFETKAKNLTTEAGERAGLEVVETLLEPVAAALTYTRTRELADPMTFMVYDLGGGTFDDSVVTWDPDVGFENRSFDGNMYLGGYDFDWQLVKWMLAHLDGYDLRLDREDPTDHGILYQLLSAAEQAKHDLSRDDEVLIAESGISDRRGEPVNIHLWLARGDFEQMLDEQLRGTLDSCDRALGKAGMGADDLSAIVMVGGSSNIPYVRRLLADRYGREPIVIDPDLCVAVGAALKAATAATRSSHLTLERAPATTALLSVDVAGRVLGGGAVRSVAGVTVRLSSDDGTLRRQEVTGGDGGVIFDDVPLQEEADNGFTAEVLVDGRVVDSQRVVVTHAWDAGGGDQVPEGDILAHDFLVAHSGGMLPIAPAGTKLPYRASTVNLETATQRGEVSVVFYEESRSIGKIVVPDLSQDLPVGTAVNVDVEFHKGWTVSATATVAGVTKHATIQLPKMSVLSWAELDERQRRAREELWHLEQSAASPETARARQAAGESLRAAEQLIAEGHDPVHAQYAVSNAETVLASVRATAPSELEPPLWQFEDHLATLGGLVSRLEAQNPNLGTRHRAGIDTLLADGRAAYAAGEVMGWRIANESAQARIEAVRHDLGTRDELPPAPVVQMALLEELRDAHATLAEADRVSYGRYAAEFGQLQHEIETAMVKVDAIDGTDGEAATVRLFQTYRREIEPLRNRANAVLQTAFGTQPTGPGADLRLPDSTMPGAGGAGAR